MLPGAPSRDTGAAGGNWSGLFENYFRKDGSFKESILLNYGKGLHDIQSSAFMSATHFVLSKVLLCRISLGAEWTQRPLRPNKMSSQCLSSISAQNPFCFALQKSCLRQYQASEASSQVWVHNMQVELNDMKASGLWWTSVPSPPNRYSRKSLTVRHVSA